MQLSPDEVHRENTKRTRRAAGQEDLALDPSSYSHYDEILQVRCWTCLSAPSPIAAHSHMWHLTYLGLNMKA